MAACSGLLERLDVSREPLGLDGASWRYARRMKNLSWLAIATVGCGAGPYGYSRTYAPLDAEREAVAGAEEYDPALSHEQLTKRLMFFGVVLRREDTAPGMAYLTVSVRALEPQNRCARADESSCRTTVSAKERGRVHAAIRYAAEEDKQGPSSIGAGSLVRVAGSLADRTDRDDHAPVFLVDYYRHWPNGYYATSEAPPK
jgi:hypothetical protein